MVALLPVRQRRTVRFLRVHRRFPRIRDPRTFSDKINWRALKDRRPELTWTCDKLAAKRRVAEVRPSVRIPETYWHGTDLAELTGVDLPDEWVLKPNGGCGLVLMGEGRIDQGRVAEVTRLTRGWLDQDLAGSTGEWAYSQAERCLFVEEKLGIGGGDLPPPNYKAYVAHGEVLRWSAVRWDGSRWNLSYFSPEWRSLGVSNVGYPPNEQMPPPASLGEMNAVAGAIAGDLDFLRVDLYEVEGEVWFGETTAYPNGGLVAFEPSSVDLEWGRLWELPGL